MSNTKISNALIVVAIFAPFYLNDLLLESTSSAFSWVAMDAAVRIFVVGFAVAIPSIRMILKQWLKAPPRSSWGWYFIITCVALLGFDALVTFPLVEAFPDWYWQVGGFPGYDTYTLRILDVTFGLMLVAVSEEVVWRGVFRHLYERYSCNRVGLIVMSAFLFALIHWGRGPVGMLMPFVSGVILMVIFLRTGSLLPGMAVHYTVNLFYYAQN